jgi:hypothetical protein
LHPSDLPNLLRLRYPVRCHECNERYTINIFIALKLRAEAKQRRNARRQGPSTSI